MSSVATRAQAKKNAEQRELGKTDSGLPSEMAPGSTSDARMASVSTPVIPAAEKGLGHRMTDPLRGLESAPDTTPIAPRRTSRSSRASTKGSRRSADYLRKRAEYEAERELALMRESLIKKKLEVDIAAIEAAEENSSADEQDTTKRVEEWMDTTVRDVQTDAHFRAPATRDRSATRAPVLAPIVVQESPASPDPSALRRGPAARHLPTPAAREEPPARRVLSPPARREVSATRVPHASTSRRVYYDDEACFQRLDDDDYRRRPASSDRRDRKIDQLAEAISKLARPRPVPQQAYELPHFSGNPADWISYRNMYIDTTVMYGFKAHENLARLKTSLHGEAKMVVEDLLCSSTKPSEIMRVLDRTFGHPGLVLECALQKIRNLPKVSPSGREVLKFAAAVRNCVSLLKNIHAPGYLHNPQLVNELLGKLTQSQRERYGDYAMGLEHKEGVDLRVSPSLEVLAEFLEHLAQATSYYVHMDLGASGNTGQSPYTTSKYQRGGPSRQVQRVHTQSEVPPKEDSPTSLEVKQKCAMCDSPDHELDKCAKFTDLDINERWATVKKHKLCFKCIVKKHSRNKCRAKRCEKCNSSHHVLLHTDRKTESVTNVGERGAKAFLKVIPVTITDISGVKQRTQCYALLDDGATVSLLDSSLAEDAKGPRVPLTIKSARGHEVTDRSSRVVSVVLHGPNGQGHKIKCRTLAHMDLPSQSMSAATIEDNTHLCGLGCEELRDAKPLLLLGQDNWELLVGQDIRRGKSGKPVASLTSLGWVIHGPVGSAQSGDDVVNCMAVSLPGLHEVVKAQFELEAIGVSEEPRKHRELDRAMAILENTSRRTPDGSQWEVGLLWKVDNTEMPDNYNHARQRLQGIEKKMDRSPEFAEAYTKQVERLVEQGYARKVSGGLEASPVWYLPHFGVVNPNKPGKLRLVFDAASTFQGTCLNDNLLTGPDLLNSLLGVLFKFRAGPIGFSGDIADMFLRIRIRPEDQGAQLFLWRGSDRQKEPEIFTMNSVIFGAVSSPVTAIYVLNKNAGEYQESHKEAVQAIKTKHYMDDYLDSVWSVEQASHLIEDVTKIHAAGGFEIRGWVTNSPELRKKLKVNMPERVALDKGEYGKERTLGMIWSPGTDQFAFDLSFKRLPSEIVDGKVIPTKREFLRFIMSIFDPLGLIYPCIIQSRMLMQKVWRSGIQWDDRLGEPEAALWFSWLSNLQMLKQVEVPRWYGLQLDELELHVFGDASELAYAAVAYLVGKGVDGKRKTAMVMGKARVAPQKVISIPRLELQAAVLASRMACTVEKELRVPIKAKFLWTDSKTVIKWINSEAHEFQKFVSHILAEIDRKTERGNWRWVPTAENPADEGTRYDWPNCNKWLSGPSFLCYPQEQWPASDDVEVAESDLERTQRVHVASTPAPPLLDYARYSTWTRALRVMARVSIFIERCRKRRPSAELSAKDLHNAELYLIKKIQEESFQQELIALRQGLCLPPSSKLRSLDPMLYSDGLLRVRGRLSACDDLSFEEKHPAILDGRHPVTRKMVQHYHTAALHANQETVVNIIRERYWVTNLRSTVKGTVAKCQMCRVRKAKPMPPKMGDLPTARLEVTRRAFVHTGVDYFGPMEVTIGRRREKRWGALFTCLTTRAVHLELAASLSADSAILALRRMIARRGQPAHLYSDRGTNFVGANTELRAALKGLNHDLVKGEATHRGIEWHFNAPAAPHMGGAWERLVRSVKNALRATLKARAPREEVLYTLLTEAELVINSRPLAYVANDKEQSVVLTPNHLLLGTASGSTPYVQPDPTEIDARAHWRRVNALADMFWRRWLREYLPTLQQRGKWTNGIPNVCVGDVVVIVDEQRPRNEWVKGIIKTLFQGSDGAVRVVDVTTNNGVLRRPVVKIAVLPTNNDVVG